MVKKMKLSTANFQHDRASLLRCVANRERGQSCQELTVDNSEVCVTLHFDCISDYLPFFYVGLQDSAAESSESVRLRATTEELVRRKTEQLEESKRQIEERIRVLEEQAKAKNKPPTKVARYEVVV